MRLRGDLVGELSVVFDDSTLASDAAKHGDTIPSLFAFGRASFGDDLLDAVALCDGIDERGRLDADMLSAARTSADYLSDKQGQPLLLVETITDPEAQPKLEGFNYILGYIAVVANVEKPVGMNGDSSSRRGRAGIATVPGYTDFDGYFETNGNYRSNALLDVTETRISLCNRRLVLGNPGQDQREFMPEREHQQHIVAGPDVVPWIREMFRGDNAYRFYNDVIFALLRHDHDPEVLDSVIDEELLGQVRNDLDMLSATEAIISSYDRESELLQKVLEGKRAEATLKLTDIENSYGGRVDMIPRTSGSYPLRVTAGLDEHGDSLEMRRKAIEFHRDYLGKLSARAAQIGS